MFTIIVHYFMRDTEHVTTDAPALFISTLNMLTVADLTVERAS